MRICLAIAFVFAACAPGVTKMKDETLPTCTTIAACNANDGNRITLVSVYGLFPDQAGVDYTGVPRAVRITLDDGIGPFLEPYWHKDAVRPDGETSKYLGKRVRVTGRYYRQQPRNPNDPPHASAMGGPCVHPVEAVELAE
jgi:hypothetical protein